MAATVAPISPQMIRETNSETHEGTSKSTFQERVEAFEEAISRKIDFNKVRELAFQGIPDSPGLRSIYWKVLLSYLPNDRSLWEETLTSKRKVYQGFIDELIIDPRKEERVDDHPLNTSVSSQWNAYFKDKELLEEIDKDVKRTLPHLHFFNHDKSIGSTQHYEALKRILFIYGKLNPGIKYVQGMNEILGPIYYIFATDPIKDFKDNAEADAFICFTNLMGEIRDNFCKTLDKSEMGITGNIARLNNVLKIKDFELWQSFEDKKLNPQFYSFRWLTLLLSQEFDLPDVLRLWDSLFADPYRFEFLYYVCTAMLVCLRDKLLDGSFADNLKMIQRYPLQDISVIISKAEELSKPDYVPPPPRPKSQDNISNMSPPPPARKSSTINTPSPSNINSNNSSSGTSKLKAFLFSSDDKPNNNNNTSSKMTKVVGGEEEGPALKRSDITDNYLPVPPKPFNAPSQSETEAPTPKTPPVPSFTIEEEDDEEEEKDKGHPL